MTATDSPVMIAAHNGCNPGCHCDGCALVRAVLVDPDEDVPRLAYAEWLMDHACEVECEKCLKTGSHAINPYELAQRYGTYNAGKIIEAAKCGHCNGTGRRSNGFSERAELIQCQISNERSRVLIVDDARERTLIEFGRTAGWWSLSDAMGIKRTPTIITDSSIRFPIQLSMFERDESYHMDFTVRRGFLDSITLPVDAFTDELCRAVFARHPVRGVRFMDTEPSRDSAIGSERVAWHLEYPPGDDQRVVIPLRVFEALEGMTTSPTDAYNLGIAVYRTRQAALSALSAAAVKHGRKVAGIE